MGVVLQGIAYLPAVHASDGAVRQFRITSGLALVEQVTQAEEPGRLPAPFP